MKAVLALFSILFLSVSAVAQRAHENPKGPNGGQMMDIAGLHAEIVVAGNALTFNIFEENGKAVGTKDFSGAALVVVGADRETVQLKPSAENALKAELKKQPGPGAMITLTLKTAAGKSGQARFKL